MNDSLISRSVVLLCAVLLQACSTTVLTAPCDNPKVSNSSVPFAYLVMLPYVYRGDGAPTDSVRTAVASLNDTAGLQVVRMGADMTDLHVTLLRDNGSGCNIESVYKVFTEKPFLQRQLLSTVVFYWGEVFDFDDGVLVQSHVRTLWKNPRENIIESQVVSRGESRVLRFTGSVPYSTVSFPARRVPVGSELGGGSELKLSLEARSAPSSTADKVPLPRRFIIEDREGDWVRLADIQNGSKVWVGVADPNTNAKSLLPELSFANALSAYAIYSRVPTRRSADNAIHSLDEFRGAYMIRSNGDAMRNASAVANAMEAVLRMDRGTRESERRRASELIDQAVAASPTSASLLNLAAVLKIEQCCDKRAAAQEIQSRLELARQLDASNVEIANNLLNWYVLLEDMDPSVLPESKDETHRRKQQLADALR